MRVRGGGDGRGRVGLLRLRVAVWGVWVREGLGLLWLGLRRELMLQRRLGLGERRNLGQMRGLRRIRRLGERSEGLKMGLRLGGAVEGSGRERCEWGCRERG